MTENKDFWREEYKSTCDRFQKYFDAYLKALVMFLGINAILIKFALDKAATAGLRLSMCISGMMFCLWTYVALTYALRTLNVLNRKRDRALKEIGLSTESDFVSARWVTVLISGVVTIVLVGWFIILFVPS